MRTIDTRAESTLYICNYDSTKMRNGHSYYSRKNHITMFLIGEDAREIVLRTEDPPNANATA